MSAPIVPRRRAVGATERALAAAGTMLFSDPGLPMSVLVAKCVAIYPEANVKELREECARRFYLPRSAAGLELERATAELIRRVKGPLCPRGQG